MRHQNDFGLSDIESALGLSSAASTVQNAQNAINTAAPAIQWVNDHIFEIIVGWFILTVLAVYVGTKIVK